MPNGLLGCIYPKGGLSKLSVTYRSGEVVIRPHEAWVETRKPSPLFSEIVIVQSKSRLKCIFDSFCYSEAGTFCFPV